MKLNDKINRLYEQIIDDVETSWQEFVKDKPISEPAVETDPEKIRPKHVYSIWFPAKNPKYQAKIRSRNLKVALMRLLTQSDTITYRGKTYNPDNYMELYKILSYKGDFGYRQLTRIGESKTYLMEDTINDWQSYISKSPMLKSAIEVLNRLSTRGHAYIVGGAVRDIITGEKDPDDIDIATNVPMEEVMKMFETYDLGKSKTFGVLGVKHGGFTFEVAQFRSDGAYLDGRRPDKVQVGVDFKTDVERRDFTINAMAVDKNGSIIDYFDGTKDIKNKTLRTVGDPHKRFGEDYLRMLRAVRFSTRMGYDIEPETYKAIQAHAGKIAKIAPERILKEIVKMAEQTGPKFAKALEILKDTGLLQYILPEVMEMDKYEHTPDKHPEGNVLQHTLEALKQNELKNPIVNLAILLHDIGKTKTYQKEGDKISYINHAEEGVAMIDAIAERLNMDNKTRDALVFGCLNHMKIHNLLDMSNNKILQLINDENWDVLYNVAYVDTKARQHLFDPVEWKGIQDKIEQLTKEYEGKKSMEAIRKVINGNWVMQLRGITEPNKQVGDIIKKTMDWLLNNNIDINDTEAIKNYILSVDTMNESLENPTQEEKEHWFMERTGNHVDLVNQAIKKIALENFNEFDVSELIKNGEDHDKSKFEEPERTPYLDISWRHKLDNYKSYKKPGTLNKEDENKATLHHIKNNTHHPEYWLEDKSEANVSVGDRDKSDKCVDASRMPPIAIAEMVSDWQAMSEELKKNTARQWYNKQKDVRWHFNEEQDRLIDKLLRVFE